MRPARTSVERRFTRWTRTGCVSVIAYILRRLAAVIPLLILMSFAVFSLRAPNKGASAADLVSAGPWPLHRPRPQLGP
jgi:peptidoglycan/LPS O-acetylase OafA/YrhL